MASMKPEVTAIITCMTDNEKPFIREAVESVFYQTSRCVVRVYAETHNEWIDALLSDLAGVEIRRLPLQPVGPVRNLAAKEAETELIAYLDGDDIWHHNKIERQLEFFEECKADLVGADHTLIRENGTLFAFGHCRYMPMPSSWLVRRRCILECPFVPVWPEDGLWWTDPKNTAVKRRLPEFLIDYRVRLSSSSSDEPSKRRKEQVAQFSMRPGGALLTRTLSWLNNRLHRSTYYRHHSDWDIWRDNRPEHASSDADDGRLAQ
jgi:glycosyltransferase involved in cell wall biosynthesis